MLPDAPGPKPSGHVAYRYIFTREELADLIFPGILEILWDDEDVCRYWLGPKAHVVLYALGHEKDLFNFELFVADEYFNASREGQEDDKEALLRFLFG